MTLRCGYDCTIVDGYVYLPQFTLDLLGDVVCSLSERGLIMTAKELFDTCASALAITEPATWQSPYSAGLRDTLIYIDDENDEDGPLWSLAANESEDPEYVLVDAEMARELIASHLRGWLLTRAWQVQVTLRKKEQQWRLVDCLSIADGGGDRLDDDYPFDDDELSVLCKSVHVIDAG